MHMFRGLQKSRSTSLLMIVPLLLTPLLLTAQEAGEEAPNPLAPLERLIGGEWHMQGTYQVFEWGVGKNAIFTRQYQQTEGEPELIGQGMMYYHPGDKTVKGTFVAVGMGIDLFDYSSVVLEENKLTAHLTTYGAMAGEFEETWEFTGEDTFAWTLYQKAGDEKSKMMEGTFERK